MKELVVIYGESGSGKSAIKKAIMRKRAEYNEVITSTTRPMREGERNGVDYFFLTDMQMADNIFKGKMAECVSFRDWVYGTSYDQLVDGKINIGVWNPEGAETLNDDTSNIKCLNIYIHTPPKIRLIRSLEREDSPDVGEIVRRFLTDEKDFRDVDIDIKTTIVNDNSKTVDEVADEIIKCIDRKLGKRL